MEAKCQDCDTLFELNERGPRKRFCGNIHEKTGCVYKRWRASIARSNQNRIATASQPKVERIRYHYQQDTYEIIAIAWRNRNGKNSGQIAIELGIPLPECNWYLEKICRAIDYGE